MYLGLNSVSITESTGGTIPGTATHGETSLVPKSATAALVDDFSGRHNALTGELTFEEALISDLGDFIGVCSLDALSMESMAI